MPPFHRLLRVVAAAAALGGAVGTVTAPASALNDPEYDKQWGLQVIGVKTAWDVGLLGAGVEIAVVDTGVHLGHQDLRDNVAPGRNYIDPSRPAQDDNKHGTHVAGIAAASIDNGGTVGVAPRARIIPLKVLRANGSGSGSNVDAAIRWAADNGAEVINLSLGEDTQVLLGPSTADAVRYAWAKGSICVFAAGNDFVLTSGFEDEPALVVASTSRSDTRSDFSNGVGNAKWGLSAPGGAESVLDPSTEDILSTLWTSDARTDTYGYLAGTSMAAPHVAGAAALLRAAGLTPQQTVDRLLATAKDLGARGRDSTFGHGRLDVARAVQGLGGGSAGPATTAAAAPAPTSGGGGGGQAAPAATATPRRTSPATTAAGGPPAPVATTAAPAVDKTLAPVTADDAFLPVPAPGPDDETAAGGSTREIADPGRRGPWLVVVLVLALGVVGAAGRRLWRRRSIDPPR